MNKFLLSEGTYSFVVDTFFDDEALFQSYLNYFAKFNSLENYLSIPTEEHIQRQFNLTASYMKERWQEGEQLSASIRKANTSFKELIEVGLLRPL